MIDRSTSCKNAKNCFKTSAFWHVVLSKHCKYRSNTIVFGWFALRAGRDKSEEKTNIYDTS